MFAQLKEKTVWTAIVRLGVFFLSFWGWNTYLTISWRQ